MQGYKVMSMRLRRVGFLTLLWTALAACVTVNIYFPAAAADRAADHIISEVWGEAGAPRGPAPDTVPTAEPGAAPAGDGESGGDAAPEAEGEADFGVGLDVGDRLGTLSASVLEAVLSALVPPAAAAEPELNISTPAIRRLEASMKRRYGSMEPYFQNGAIGLTNNGSVAVRDLKVVGLRERGRVKLLVDEENADRKSLYREIAKANHQPGWEGKIREVFARRWINRAPGGWYYQDASGRWKQK
jgi:uncharacterized protein YdbL (DUF1318 family)